MSRHPSSVKEKRGGDYAEAVTQGSSGVKGGTCQDEDKVRGGVHHNVQKDVRGGGHHNVQEDVGRNEELLKRDDANWGRSLELTTEVSHQYQDASILKGDTSSKEEKAQALIESESTKVSMDGSVSRFLQYQEETVKDDACNDKLLEQAVEDETVEDGYLEQAVKDEIVRDELPPDRKGISAKALLQHHVDMDSQDVSVLLPTELVLILFKFMKPGDVLAASQTCQLWRELGENDKLWEQICQEAGLAFSLSAANLRALERRKKKTTIAYSAWKENFLKPYKIAKKFRQEIPQVLKVKMSRDVKQMKFFNDKIVATSDNNLYIFCAVKGKLLHELVGQTSRFEVIQINKQFIVSGGGLEKSVKVWNVDTGSLHTLLVHPHIVECLQMHGNILVSLSCDGTLWMWDVQEGRSLKTITGDIGCRVDHIEFDGRLVVSGTRSSESIIKVWDTMTGECLHTLDQQSRFKYFKLHGGHVLVMHDDGSIKVWEVDTGVYRHTLVGVEHSGGYMKLQADRLVTRCAVNVLPVYLYPRRRLTCADVGRAKIWSVSTGACLHTLAGPQKHSRCISGIGLSDKLVVTSSMDRKVKLWDIKTGEFIRDLFMLESGGMVIKMEMKDAKIVCLIRVVRRSGNAQIKLLILNFDTNDAD